ncbi:hypothetical protein [Metapseudomonas otitidis]|uniref:hypothetical protein n=1 Tax=Metapseudomonas otitidis TaxID=319939 RepID=UPI000D1A9289|nr:hypothetical protein [Pseudomonas otitidis]
MPEYTFAMLVGDLKRAFMKVRTGFFIIVISFFFVAVAFLFVPYSEFGGWGEYLVLVCFGGAFVATLISLAWESECQTHEEDLGAAWWAGLTEGERRRWMEEAGNTGRPDDAWAAFKDAREKYLKSVGITCRP